MMRIWLVTIGEPLPIGDTNVRLLRAGLLAEKLISRGHKVLWWASTFDHSKKQHLFSFDKRIDISESFCIYLLHSLGYKKNVSIRRLLNHLGVANKFNYYSRKELTPDVILCSMPTLELSLEATRYGKEKNVPVILDLRDMWPDIFVSRAPYIFQWLLERIFTYFFSKMRISCQDATAITGITRGYVDWGLGYAKRKGTYLDKDFPMGYRDETHTLEQITAAKSFWIKHGIHYKKNEFIVCLFSNMVRQLELETVLYAAHRLGQTGRRFRFVLCGNGESLKYFMRIAEGCDNVIFPGWVDKTQIWSLMRIAQVGLAPYRSTKDFIISIPNKIIEYMSAGLPIVSSLKGTVEELLFEHQIGFTYQNENVDSLFCLLCDLYDNREKVQIISKNSQKLFKERFDVEKVYSGMCDYIEQIAMVNKGNLQ